MRPQRLFAFNFEGHKNIAEPVRNPLRVIPLAQICPAPASECTVALDQFHTISRFSRQRVQNTVVQCDPFPVARKVGNLNPTFFLTGLRIQQQAVIAVDHVERILRRDKRRAMDQVVLRQLAFPQDRAVVSVPRDQPIKCSPLTLVMSDVAHGQKRSSASRRRDRRHTDVPRPGHELRHVWRFDKRIL